MKCIVCLYDGKRASYQDVAVVAGYSICEKHLKEWAMSGHPTVAEWIVGRTTGIIIEALEEHRTDISSVEGYPITSVLVEGERIPAESIENIEVIDRISYPPYGAHPSEAPLEVEVTAVTSEGEETPLEPGDVLTTNPKPKKRGRPKKKRTGGK
jgi:hypothetical protein